jgi:uncharacterized membrane protein YgdD (TMEM256/DUF423 family)
LEKLKIIAIVQLFLGVAFGAFGAHALKNTLSEADIQIWQTATHYLMVHGLGALIAANSPSVKKRTVVFFVLGNFIFSGSLYALCLSQIRVLGAITPVGGVCYLLAWAFFAYDTFRSKLNTGINK